jgi:hypothetical protein
MPSGLSRIRQLADESAARQAAFDELSGGRFFSLPNSGDRARVRFLEQGDDVKFFWTHQLPAKPGQQFGDSVLCLDQDDKGVPCPACVRGKNRTPRVCINLIWYGAPRFVREPGQDGRPGKVKKDPVTNAPLIDGVEDVVATWGASQTVGGRLDTLHKNAEGAGGLMMGVYIVQRRGIKKNTEWDIDLDSTVGNGGYVQPTQTELALYQAKPDPKWVMREYSFGDMERAYSGGIVVPGQGAPAGAFAAAAADVQQRGAFGGAPVEPVPASSEPGGINQSIFG